MPKRRRRSNSPTGRAGKREKEESSASEEDEEERRDRKRRRIGSPEREREISSEDDYKYAARRAEINLRNVKQGIDNIYEKSIRLLANPGRRDRELYNQLIEAERRLQEHARSQDVLVGAVNQIAKLVQEAHTQRTLSSAPDPYYGAGEGQTTVEYDQLQQDILDEAEGDLRTALRARALSRVMEPPFDRPPHGESDLARFMREYADDIMAEYEPVIRQLVRGEIGADTFLNTVNHNLQADVNYSRRNPERFNVAYREMANREGMKFGTQALYEPLRQLLYDTSGLNHNLHPDNLFLPNFNAAERQAPFSRMTIDMIPPLDINAVALWQDIARGGPPAPPPSRAPSPFRPTEEEEAQEDADDHAGPDDLTQDE